MAWDHPRPQVSLQKDKQADQYGKTDAVPKNGAQHSARIWAVWIATGRDARYDDALRVDHLTHHPA